jgi:DNA repair exonuclease SbcCD ATPase subunit
MGDFKFIPKGNNKWDVKAVTPGTNTYIAKIVSNGSKNELLDLIEEQGRSTEGINIRFLNKKNSSLNSNAQALLKAKALVEASQKNKDRTRSAAMQQMREMVNRTLAEERSKRLVADAAKAQNLGASTSIKRTSSFSSLGSLFGKSKNPNTSGKSPNSSILNIFRSKPSPEKSERKATVQSFESKLKSHYQNKMKTEAEISKKEQEKNTTKSKIDTDISNLRSRIEQLTEELEQKQLKLQALDTELKALNAAYNTTTNKEKLEQIKGKIRKLTNVLENTNN